MPVFDWHAQVRFFCAVKKYFAILLILLLPLRGWSADHMASMPSSHAELATATAALAEIMPPECAHHISATQQQSASTANHSSHVGHAPNTCQACQLCMPLALPPSGDLIESITNPQARLVLPALDFASIALAPSVKPPIASAP